MTLPRGSGRLPGAGLPPLHLTILVILMVHALGHFAYMGIWRNLTAPDFDVNDFKAYYTAGLALRTGQAMPAAVPAPGRAQAIACARYLPGESGSCGWAEDPRGSGLASGGN